ncbi:MAG: orotidine 5'-phosphate decarboxylase / HUMPS family protein [archaeon]
MNKIIQRERSIIPACDVPLDLYEEIVKETTDVDGVGGYKIGFQLGLTYGLPKVVGLTRQYNDKPIIYDHQKAGTDIPDTGKNFAKTIKNAGVDAVIFFPQSGPETEKAWIEAALEQDLGVIVGGLMTHSKYVRSEGGYLADDAITEMYLNAAKLGVSDFVVPGNRPDDIKRIKGILEQEGVSPTFYAPGFVAQGGLISDAAQVAGNSWHAIVGRGIYKAEDIKEAALELTSKL